MKKQEELIRAKWAMDGARTLKGAAKKLRELADELEALHAAGWELTSPVEDDYGCIERKAPKRARKAKP